MQLEEEVKRLRQESSDWSTQSHRLEEELQREREERAREVKKTRQDFEEESKVMSLLNCSIFSLSFSAVPTGIQYILCSSEV